MLLAYVSYQSGCGDRDFAGRAIRLLRLVWLLAFCATLELANQAQAAGDTPREATWVTNGTVNAIARTSDTVYLGGTFTQVGPYTGNGVPIDAMTGQPALSYPKVNGAVHACAADGTGGWYIGGEFTQVGGLTRNRLAHLLADGTVDLAWEANANSTVWSLTVSGSTVYAGGWFTNIGGQTRNHLAALDAATGVATAWNSDANNSINALSVSGSTIYAGGQFTIMGGVSRTYIAQFGPAPAPPTSPGTLNIGQNAITWSWQDVSNQEDGYLVYSDPGTASPATLRATTAANAMQWTQSGLSPNTQYAFQTAATNILGTSNLTDHLTTWTLIEPIASLSFSGVETDSISVAPTNTPSNLAAGFSGIYFINTTAATDSGWQQSAAPWTSSGLTPNTQYSFSGVSRNGSGVETAPCTGTTSTLAAVPLMPVVNIPA